MRDRWTIDDHGQAVHLARRGSAPVSRAYEPHRAARSVERWFPDGSHRPVAQLGDIDRALHPLGAASNHPDARRDRLRRALLDGLVVAWRGDAPRTFAAPVDGAHDDAGPAHAAPRVAETDTWITVELVDEVDALLAGVRYRILLPDRSLREGALNAAGSVHLDGLTPGECVVTFPDLDAEAWSRPGVVHARVRRGDEGVTRTVAQGDTTDSLAAARGLFRATVWDHPRNADLRAKRRDPNILRAGDVLFLPDRVLRDERCATGRVHRFRRRGVPLDLNLRCLDIEGAPYAGEPFHLTGGGVDLRGALDGDGWMRVKIPPAASRLRLAIGADGEHEDYELRVGHLDPHDELTGVCDRLRNLGYYAGPSVTEPTAQLADAVRWFRRTHDLGEGGAVDEALREALRRGHHA